MTFENETELHRKEELFWPGFHSSTTVKFQMLQFGFHQKEGLLLLGVTDEKYFSSDIFFLGA